MICALPDPSLQDKTEAKIRREREKLERCERRIRKLQGGGGREEGGLARDLPRAYMKKGVSEEEGEEGGSSPHVNANSEGCETNVDPSY